MKKVIKKISRRFLRTSKRKQLNEKLRKKTHSVSIAHINIFPQPRQIFDEKRLEDLVISIRRNGLMHPLSVACFSKKEMIEHIRLRNLSDRQKIEIKLENLIESNGYYYVLIAGERRLRAIKIIIENKKDKYKGENFYMFANKKVECSLYRSPSFYKFISMQLDENDEGEKPSSHEEAEYIDINYGALKVAAEHEKKKFTLAGFAKKIGKSTQTVRSALRFSELPKIIKKFVYSHTLSYGVACQITRLQIQNKLKESELIYWANLAVAKKASVKSFKETINKAIATKKEKSNIFNLFQEDEIEILKKAFRVDMNKNILLALYVHKRYINKIHYLFDNKLVDKEDSPYAKPQALKEIGEIVDVLNDKILPHIRSLENETYFKESMRKAKQLKLTEKIDKVKETYKKIS